MDQQLTTIDRLNCLLAGALILAAALVGGRRVALGAALGAILSCANFYAMHRLLAVSLAAAGRRRTLLAMLLAAKLAVLATLVFVALRYLPLSPVAFAAGLSVFLLSIMISSVHLALTDKAEDGRAQ